MLARVTSHLTRQYLARELRRSRDRLDRELANAADMQRRLLPRRMPAHPAVEFAAFYQTSRHAGGDYYDVIRLDADRFAVVVADVSGHGAPAAIVMAMIRAVLHTCDDLLQDPAAVLHHLNRHFEFLWDTAMFATAVYGVLDVGRGTWRSIRAGHPPPLVVGPGRTVTTVTSGESRMLLFGELGDLVAHEQTLAAGDRLVLYTDGVTDRQGPDGQLYDVERLSATVARHADRAPAVLLELLVDDVESFVGGREADDDQTLLVVGLEQAAERASSLKAQGRMQKAEGVFPEQSLSNLRRCALSLLPSAFRLTLFQRPARRLAPCTALCQGGPEPRAWSPPRPRPGL